MTILSAVSTVIVPLVAFVVPGIVLTTAPRRLQDLPVSAASTILWSLALLTLSSFVVVLLNVPIAFTLFVVIAIMAVGLSAGRWKSWQDPRAVWLSLTLGTIVLAIITAFSVPYFTVHDGLPTGDAQKTIFWAQRILQSNAIPDYTISRALLNRDPVDFYTPGLHTFSALVMRLSGHPLISIGMLSIIAAIALALIGMAIAAELFPGRPWVILVPLFILTNIRFLRYLREPGYHLQNVMGEVLLFGIFLLAVRLVKRWRWLDAILATIVALALTITHQFSAFIGFFAVLPLIVAAIVRYRHAAGTIAKRHPWRIVGLVVAPLLLILSGLAIDLHLKIPHLFTLNPHLLHLVPTLTEYPDLMGGAWLILGLAGLVAMGAEAMAQKRDPALAGFTLSILMFLVLSQGPRLGIDVPPVRALFYTVLPLSITGAYFLSRIWHLPANQSPIVRRAFRAFTVFVLMMSAGTSVSSAYALSHTVRTNATLTAEQSILIEHLRGGTKEGSVLIDDYNRRSASWLILSGRPMYTRIAADLEQQMNEAHQSVERREIYMNQLDFEKIFSLGSWPEAAELLRKHNITHVTGIENSSATAFQNNPALHESVRAGDIILYTLTDSSAPTNLPKEIANWLLQPTTLVNDIGDREDTFEHLPASLRATRLSTPIQSGRRTFRATTAPLIPLQFNIGDYVRILWEDKFRSAAFDLQLLIFASSSEPLTVTTAQGNTYRLPAGPGLLKIPSNRVPWNEEGFMTITINNPSEASVEIDFIALGLTPS